MTGESLSFLFVGTLTKRSDGVYTMTYDGDYGFDEFLKTGASSDAELEAFVVRRLMHGLPIDLHVTDAGCTAAAMPLRRTRAWNC